MIRPTKAFGPHDLAAGTDRHRNARQVLLGESRTNDLPPLLHRAGPLLRRGRIGNGCHVLRVRVEGRRRGAHVHQQAEDANRDHSRCATTISASQICVRFHLLLATLSVIPYSDLIATIGWTVVARRAAGRPASSATAIAIADAPA